MISASKLYLIFVLGLVLLVLSFFDNVVMQSSIDSFAERKSLYNNFIFASIVGISIAGQSLILYLVIKMNLSLGKGLIGKSIWIFQILAVISLCTISSLLLYLLVNITYQKFYDAEIYRSIVYVSYAFSILNMGFLLKLLATWYNRNIGIVLLLYMVAFSAYLANEIFSAAILNSHLEISSEIISYVVSPGDNLSYIESPYINIYNITSIVSFTGIWLGTCLLLHHYSSRVGRLKFWILVVLPLIYYLVNWDIFRSNTIDYVMNANSDLLDPVLFVLGGVKQAGGFFFAISFIIISRHVTDQKIKFYLIISGTGIMLLFGSSEISLLQLIPYPPYSLTTISMISISSFLLLIGLHYIAQSMAHDRKLLEFARKIVNQKASKFLYDLGSAQWQREMDRTLPIIMDVGSNQTDATAVSTSLTEEEVRNYINEISEEIKKLQDEKNS